jgi:signal transduction histidine kinase
MPARIEGAATVYSGEISPSGVPLTHAAPLHVVQFYENEAAHVGAVVEFLRHGLLEGESAVVLAGREHSRIYLERLSGNGLSPESLRCEGRLVVLEAEEMLALLLAEGAPDFDRFFHLLGSVLDEALAVAPSGRVRVYGELVALLAQDGNFSAALALERLWNSLGQSRPFSLLCAYPLRQFARASLAQSFEQVCDLHHDVFTEEKWSQPGAHVRSSRLIVGLQQQARALQAEVAERRRTEARLALLARVSEALASSLDYDTVLDRVIALALPALGDFGYLDIVEGDREVRRLARAHEDPETEALLAGTRWVRYTGGDTNLCALSSGVPALHCHIDAAWYERVAQDPEHLAFMRRLGFCSMLTVPLRYEDRALGALTLFFGRSGRHHHAADLELAREIAQRAAASVENARLYRELQQAMRRQIDADRRKDEFLAMLGHELRNPLAPILTALQLMEMRGESRIRREREVIRRQAEHLTRLVDDLLDVSRVARGKIELRKEVVELAAVLGKAIELASPLLEQRAHKLSVSVPRVGLAVEGDSFRLAQIFSNLLTNAAKFTDRGGRIGVSARREGGDVVIEVSDTGCGIPKEMLASIFDLFVQGARSLDRAQGGLGLGLALVKNLTELHGGSVAVDSEGPGQGSTFYVRLPALPVALQGTSSEESAQDEQDRAPRRTRVLVVDDNRDAVDTMAEALCDAGFDVAVAYDGPEALGSAEASPPDVALVDIGLPVMDGYELGTRLLAGRPPGTLRLIAVTGYGQESDRERSRQAGFELHLVKPVDIETILRAVEG